MPKSTSWGVGRTCLVVRPAGGGSSSVARHLAAAGFTTLLASSEEEALAVLDRETLAAALIPRSFSPVAITTLVARAGHQHPAVPVVVLGASGTVQEAVDAMQQGAADYLAPPFDAETLLARLRRLLEQVEPPGPAPLAPVTSFTGLIGGSAAIRRVLSTIDKISRYKTNVLILGESGTGKELIARALHARGPRRQQLFVPLNCATLGRELLENELFGHERGAFTGADDRKKGLFELADGARSSSTIAEMDPATQAKLLRVLERNEFRRVGGTGKVKVDLSVLAATNRNIDDAIRAGRFRDDLYYRLKVVTLVIPPLRERKEDVPALIDSFIADFNRRNDQKIRGITPQALRAIMDHDWPGNVRELKNAVESAAILATGDTIGLDGFAELGPGAVGVAGSGAAGGGQLALRVGCTLAAAERDLILATLRRHPDKRAAASVLGIGLRTLYTKLGQYRR
ncbi:MAG: sigma-54-dependent Fis family transcriptional regulator [Anaeromyxobacter sp.]|nr:sigma-54-dependent Fis family transcriptional regulator [Anaeromyxobacter sp.]